METVTDDERALIHFLLWDVRVRDLPPPIIEAAARVAASKAFPRHGDLTDEYVEGAWRVSLIPADDDAPIGDARPLAVGASVDALLEAHPDCYAVLIQRAA